jgi:hypothetical protein
MEGNNGRHCIILHIMDNAFNIDLVTGAVAMIERLAVVIKIKELAIAKLALSSHRGIEI